MKINVKKPRSRAERLTVTVASAAALGGLAVMAASPNSEPKEHEPVVEYVPQGDLTTVKVKDGEGEMDLSLRLQRKAGHEYDSLRDAMNDPNFQGTLQELEERFDDTFPQQGEKVPAHTEFIVKE